MTASLPLIVPQWAVPMPNVAACMTTRSGGISQGVYGALDGQGGLNLGTHVNDAAEAVQTNRARLRMHLPSEPAWLTQVHGTQVVDAATVVEAPEADASYTTQPHVVCGIMTADCLPVLFADVSGNVVAAAHAGWRGLASGVLTQTVRRMRTAGGSTIQAWLGPAIGPSRFEVGEDVRQIFLAHDVVLASAFHAIDTRPGKYLADIYALARASLAEEGVTMVTGGEACTVSEPERFYSFRRDGVTGRMAALIWRTA
ncbi:peptidoglycan editing factor PgeF [Oxalicibacterium faecigallinarum]|uniref:peptidoglycan editing factor PgeF n=1 Tax=Oxalicibacterium faecigallinarum TaxID=573741 RepID=UPI00280ACC54|nr:peptidoglycan editing factor PgeF [Oxalicibacterium faecigallinarum]